ncbi:MAG: DUF4254 domain-containing protein, partial [Desulfovibrionales bacterium]
MMTATAIKESLSECIQAQLDTVAQWHEPDSFEKPGGRDLLGLVLAEHWINFSLWHTEDEARRTDVGAEVIAECKRKIDRLNQQRNDQIEVMDRYLVDLISPLLPEDAKDLVNTETLGMALDRLSIL